MECALHRCALLRVLSVEVRKMLEKFAEVFGWLVIFALRDAGFAVDETEARAAVQELKEAVRRIEQEDRHDDLSER